MERCENNCVRWQLIPIRLFWSAKVEIKIYCRNIHLHPKSLAANRVTRLDDFSSANWATINFWQFS
jgi:hypothetical protein